jgi:23S rRNA (guanosine2251-2'-O)-methyltransferase
MSSLPPDKGRRRRRKRGAGPGQPDPNQQPATTGRPGPRGQRQGGPGGGPGGYGARGGRPAQGRSGTAGRGGGQQRGGGQGGAARSVPKGQLPDNAIYGINPISMALSQGLLKALYHDPGSTSERIKQLHAQAADSEVNILPLSKAGWARAIPADHHQGVVGMIYDLPPHFLEEIVEQVGDDSCVLVLDRVQDPQNLGAILRTAAATGVDAVVLPKAGGASVTAAVHKASAGLSMKVRIVEDENLARAIDFLKDHGYWVIGCDSGEEGEEPEDATTFEYPRKRVLVMGNEAEGLRRLVRESCDYIVRIPMEEGVESLNVSVATAVVLYLAKADLARAELEETEE